LAWHLPAETGQCGRRICSQGRGWSSRFSPPSATSLHSPMRRGRLAGQGGPLHPCHAGVNAGPHALRLQHLKTLSDLWNRECRKLLKRCRCVGSRAGSCATCKPPGDRHRRTGSTRRSFSRDEGRRLAFRKCRGAWPSRRELKTKAACGLRPLIPGALDKAAAAAYGAATAHPAGPAAAPAGAPGCGRGSTAT
jgi:hypothetical protein